jgi:hypothetical protein
VSCIDMRNRDQGGTNRSNQWPLSCTEMVRSHLGYTNEYL